MTNNQTGTDEIEIDLLKLAEVLLHHAKAIIASILLVAAAAFGITYYLITPQYTATALMYVNNSSFSVGSTSFSISSAELTAAKSLVDTYVVILKSRNTLEEIIRQDNLTYTYEELYDMIESGAVNSTEIFEVNVTSPSPAEAEHIANTIAAVLPDKIASIVEGSDVRIVDYAVVPSHRTSPSYTVNTVIGALVGLVFASAIVILRYLFDESIRSEDYLTQTYPSIPLLAVVPDMMQASKGNYGDYYSSRSSSQSSDSGTKRARPTQSQSRPAKAARSARSEAESAAPAQKRPRPADGAPRPAKASRSADAEKAPRVAGSVRKGGDKTNG